MREASKFIILAILSSGDEGARSCLSLGSFVLAYAHCSTSVWQTRVGVPECHQRLSALVYGQLCIFDARPFETPGRTSLPTWTMHTATLWCFARQRRDSQCTCLFQRLQLYTRNLTYKALDVVYESFSHKTVLLCCKTCSVEFQP